MSSLFMIVLVLLALLVGIPVAASLLFFIYYQYQIHSGCKTLAHIPLAEPRFPVGSLHFLKDYFSGLEHFYNIRDAKTGLSRIFFFTRETLFVTKPEHAQKVFVDSTYRHNLFVLRHHMCRFFGPYSITLLMNEEWMTHRNWMNQAFQYQHHAHYAELMALYSEKLNDVLLEAMLTSARTQEEGQERGQKKKEPTRDFFEIDILPYLKALTADVICSAAFGVDFKALENIKYGPSKEMQAFQYLLEESSRRMFRGSLLDQDYDYLPTNANKLYREARGVIRTLVLGIIEQRREGLQKEDQATLGRRDALHYLLSAEDSATFTNDMVFDELFTLMFAGFDTTALGLGYALHFLSLDMGRQEKLQVEADLVFSKRGSFGLESSSELTYSANSFKESLRLYPPAPVTTRATVSDIMLDDVLVPAGTSVFLPLSIIQRDPASFTNPDDFIPERFEKAIPPGAWVPFSAGRRNCLGQKFAMLEGTLALASLARRFTFSPSPSYCFEVEHAGVIQRPKYGVLLRLAQRHF